METPGAKKSHFLICFYEFIGTTLMMIAFNLSHEQNF